jgi:hypothetical protein
MLTAEQLEKIENAREVEVHYKRPYQYRWAVIRYGCRKNKPLKVASYYIYGEKLKTGEPIRCWEYLPSTNFNIVADGFNTEEEAIARMKELRSTNND